MAAILLLLLFIACNRNSDSKQTLPEVRSDKINANETGKPEFYQTDSAAIPDQKQKEPAPANKPNPDWDKKIIKNATLELEVKEVIYSTKTCVNRLKILAGI